MSKELADKIDDVIIRLQDIKALTEIKCQDFAEHEKLFALPKNTEDLSYNVKRYKVTHLENSKGGRTRRRYRNAKKSRKHRRSKSRR